MKRQKNIFWIVGMLVIAAIALSVPLALNAGNAGDAMDAIEADEILGSHRVGEKVTLSDDGYIGVPVEMTTYYDTSNGAVRTGYNGTPVMLYVVNTKAERIGTDSDVSIIRSMLERGYAVVVLDYKGSNKAVSPELDWSVQALRARLTDGAYFTDKAVFPNGSYYECAIIPAGYDIRYRDVFFEQDKHGTDGTLEKIVNVWNNDFRMYHGNTVIKWTHGDGTRKNAQNGFDGTTPTWLDASGNASADGEYIKIKYTKAETITDCVKADGSPIDLDLCMNIVYPTHPEKDVPVMSIFVSTGALMTGTTSEVRPQFNAFIFNGYAGVMFDYGWVPMGRNDHYGYFDGSSGSKSVTGDNQSYATYTYNSSQVATAAMRYIRYLSLSDHDTFSFNNDKIGVYGISKAAWMTFLGDPMLGEDLITVGDGVTEADIAEAVNAKVNGFYQLLYLEGHHGETRYDNGITETYTVDGFTVDGGELQPWAVYDGKEIASGAQFVYSCAGATLDYMREGYAPMFISVNMRDTYNTEYGAQNMLTNLCRIYDIPTLWLEADIAHTFACGEDRIYGMDAYTAFPHFADYYLKDAPVYVAYTSPSEGGAGVSALSPITIKFMGEVDETEILKVTIKDGSGRAAAGRWTSAYGRTEWTFTPEPLTGGSLYTVTVPAGITGTNGKTMESDYVFRFRTAPESTTSADIASALTLTSDGDTFVSVPAPAMTAPFNRIVLRLKAENDAANTVLLYSASGNGDTSGALLGTTRVKESGYFEFDVTDYVAAFCAGSNVTFRLRTAYAEGSGSVYSHDFAAGRGDFTTSGYGTYSAATVGGRTAYGLTVGTNAGKYDGDHVYYSQITALTNKKIIDGGRVLAKADDGRRFTVTLSVYDTISRPLRLTMNSATNKDNETLDYDRFYYTVQTVAGEWTEFTIPYTVYETLYGDIGCQQKIFYVIVNSDGDTGSPIYFGDFVVREIYTDVSVGEVSLALTSVGDRPYKAPEGTGFSVKGVRYESWSEAVGAAGSGGTVTLLAPCTLGDRDVCDLSAKNGLIIDLNGYTVTAETSVRSLLWLGGQDASECTLTLRNGTILLSDSPLINYLGASCGKKYNINIENVCLSLSERALTRDVMSAPSSPAAGTKVNVSFNGSTVEILRGRLAENKVTVFGAGDGSTELSYSFTGGEIVIDSTKDITYSSGLVKAFPDGEDKYVALRAQASLARIPDISVLCNGNYGFFAPGGEEDGYNVYTPVAASIQTEYGAIPDIYADAEVYPLAVFCGGSLVAMTDNWGQAQTKAIEAVSGAAGSEKTAVILLRADVVNDTSVPQLGEAGGTIKVDLAGHTLTRGTSTLFEVKGRNPWETKVEIFNGTITAIKGAILHLNHADEKTLPSYTSRQTFRYTFENVVFNTPADTNPGNLICVSYYDGGTIGVNVCLDLYGCTFDLRNAHSSAWITLFNLKDNGGVSLIDGKVNVYGGTLIANTLEKVSLLNSNPEDSMIWHTDGNGDPAVLLLPTSYSPVREITFRTDDGECSFGSGTDNGDGTITYVPTLTTVVTPYGTIPKSYINAESYPFAIFFEGKFVSSKSDWKEAIAAAKSKLAESGNAGKTVTVLMRADADTNASIGSSTLSAVNGKIVLDLGGFTMARTSNSIIDANAYNHAFDTYVDVINGTIVAKNNIIALKSYISDTSVTTRKNFHITFENVTFAIAKDSTANPLRLICVSWAKDSSADASAICGATIACNNCVFDLRDTDIGRAPGYTTRLFSVGQNTVAADITVNGGTFLGDFGKVTIVEKDSGDTFNFGQYGGKNDSPYPVFKLTAGSLPTAGQSCGAAGNMYFRECGNETLDGVGATVYRLYHNTNKSAYGYIPAEYARSSQFPLLAFIDGEFVGGAANWGKMTELAAELVGGAGSSDKTVLFWLRTNHTVSAAGKTVGNIGGTLVIDLDGHTLTRTNNSIFESNANDANAGYLTRIIVKNGVWTSSSGSRFITSEPAKGSDPLAVKRFSYVFENVTFIAGSATNHSKGFMTITYGSAGIPTVLDMTFNDCTFDLTPTSSAVTMFRFDQDTTAGSVVINGGKIKTGTGGITLCSGNNDSVTFGKNGSGNYTQFELPVASDVPGGIFFTEDGTALCLGDKTDSVYVLDKHVYAVIDGDLVCARCGEAYPGIGAMLAGHTLSLSGDIGLNFYMLLGSAVLSDGNAFMRFTLPNGTVKDVPVSEAETKTIDGKTYCVFSCGVAAKEMTGTVKARLYGNGGSTDEFVYTVKEYADYILAHASENAEYAAAAPMIRAMLDYGAYSQVYFGNAVDELANGGVAYADISAVTAATLLPYKNNASQENALVKLEGVQLLLGSKTTLRLCFTVKSENVTFTCGGKVLEPVSNGKYVLVDVSDIAAPELSGDVTVTVSDGEASYDITYNVMSYCYNVLSRATDATRTDALKDAIRALYLYGKAAETYFGK